MLIDPALLAFTGKEHALSGTAQRGLFAKALNRREAACRLKGGCSIVGVMKWSRGSDLAGSRIIRRTGLVTLALFTGMALAALALAQICRLGFAQTLVSVLLGGGAPAGLYLAWATYSQTLGRDELSLAQVADRFALAVSGQWEAEAGRLRLNDPYPLPVAWGPADASLFDSWDHLRASAAAAPPAACWQPLMHAMRASWLAQAAS
jgi:hypothetical protein